jgi:hypothetical protein
MITTSQAKEQDRRLLEMDIGYKMTEKELLQRFQMALEAILVVACSDDKASESFEIAEKALGVIGED